MLCVSKAFCQETMHWTNGKPIHSNVEHVTVAPFEDKAMDNGLVSVKSFLTSSLDDPICIYSVTILL